MLAVERVREVPDGEDQTDELAQRDDERDRERGAALGQMEHGADADVSERQSEVKETTTDRREKPE